MTCPGLRVQPVVMPFGDRQSWTLLDRDFVVVEAAEAFLSHLHAVERSPNTVKAYAHDLRDWFEFLGQRGLLWSQVRLEDVGRFVAWLRLPGGARLGNVAALPTADSVCTEATVNRKLSAISAFYEFHQRHGVDLGDLLTTWQRRGTRGGSWRPLLANLGDRPERSRRIRLRAEQRIPETLDAEQIAAIVAACDRLRDQFLFSVLAGSGLRIGEALGLRHSDIDAAARLVSVVPRRNANGARAKGVSGRRVPVGAGVIRLYADYLHTEYGDLDSDYVFVNLWSGPVGHPMTYASVYDLVCRIRQRTAIMFGPHVFRHSYATELLRRGVAVEVVAHLLGHSSIATTGDTYAHLKIEDARGALVAAGWLADSDEPR
ncbi:tyrosine-type recombinase/integrase [Mycobacterium crocinum]|uniref:Site-specific integrase n=1 Tax=Mycolicibacterium crocinum TaxID=388459 RepID=A0ABY3TPN0_9MYCO|nr:tyrosine-type recombinase/integrase [Mycolicibacterium crocinum]MCV7214631.1 tyrosine-type recombinase/integrase [Mycolicibacterium crocinum]ULN41674.1 site-specific integrase [Mycolicibacterium crocinum]